MRHVLAATVAATAAFTLGGCYTSSESVTFEDGQAPVHEHGWQDWWSHQFVYHPEQQAYFEPYSGTYHWFENGAWVEGDSLPLALNPDPELAEIVFLQNGQAPWDQHPTVTTNNPPVNPFRPAAHDAIAWADDNGWPSADDEGETTFANAPTDDRP